MKRLPKNKRNQLIGVTIATVGLICAVYFLLISPQKQKNNQLASEAVKETAKLQQYKNATTAKEIDSTTTNLTDIAQQLDHAEQDLASGDLYAWTVDTIRHYKANYRRVDVATIGQPIQSDCDLIGGFPYKQIRFSITGTAFYHDLGKFVSDFENTFPHCRVLNLSLDPSGIGEKLSFRIDIVALVKSNN